MTATSSVVASVPIGSRDGVVRRRRDEAPAVNEMTTIGVLSPVTGGFYYGCVLAGISRELRSIGGRIVFIQTLEAGIGGVAVAVDHLVGHGHTRIGFAANLVQSDMRERHEGFRSALTAHGLELREEWILDAPDNGELGGADVARRLLDSALEITALVLATDRNAIGCIGVLAERGVKVPDDLAVIGFDGIDAGAYSTPTLTTVSQRFDDIGAAAAKL